MLSGFVSWGNFYQTQSLALKLHFILPNSVRSIGSI
ncbi:hypothetical protein MTR67_040506 [Solanum verrucosum]|uniref:Uncharacterized protein n=1 Tax=Solanum verrucosum TaxID=315347 RepID=A0AAF0UKC1_SOLVR|nr:hypothetical protein MTR67_040506 [Solanum verrucosum]